MPSLLLSRKNPKQQQQQQQQGSKDLPNHHQGVPRTDAPSNYFVLSKVSWSSKVPHVEHILATCAEAFLQDNMHAWYIAVPGRVGGCACKPDDIDFA